MSFFRNLYSYEVFDLKTKIRDPKLLSTPNNRKTERPSTFSVVTRCQNDDDAITLKRHYLIIFFQISKDFDP